VQGIFNDDGWEKDYYNDKGIFLKRIILEPVAAENDPTNDKVFIGLFLQPVLQQATGQQKAVLGEKQRVARFDVFEHHIAHLPHKQRKNAAGEDTIERRSPMRVYTVVDTKIWKKYRYVYFRSYSNGDFDLGTRDFLGAKWSSHCTSRKQRVSPEAIAARKEREKKYERRIRKRFDRIFAGK
jgi:hypothetical protein